MHTHMLDYTYSYTK